jgi:hypothetical protein
MAVPRQKANGVRRTLVPAVGVSLAVLLASLAFVGFEPAAPEVDPRTLLMSDLERGTFVVDVRGRGRWCPRRFAGLPR